MKDYSKITSMGLGLALAVGLTQVSGENSLSLNEGNAVVAGAANILLIYFVLALVIERGCEVVMDLFTALGIVPPKETSPNAPIQPNRMMVGVLVCLVFSMAISLTGMRLAEAILNIAIDGDFKPEGYFAHMDTLLTAFFLAGGSEGIHRIIRRLLPDQTAPADA